MQQPNSVENIRSAIHGMCRAQATEHFSASKVCATELPGHCTTSSLQRDLGFPAIIRYEGSVAHDMANYGLWLMTADVSVFVQCQDRSVSSWISGGVAIPA
jgi:hypothetical protein